MTAEMFFFYFWKEPKEGVIGLLLVGKKEQLLLKDSFLGRGEELSSEKWIEPAKIISERNNPVPSRKW